MNRLEHRISILGLGPKAAALLNAGMSPAIVAETLNIEDQDKLEDELTPISKEDVVEYRDFLRTLEAKTLQGLQLKGVDEKALTDRVRERLSRTLTLADKFDSLVTETLEDREKARDAWNQLVDQGVMPREYYPAKQIRLLVEIAAESRAMVKDFHQDRGVQSFIKSAVVNVNQGGMSMRDVVMILREMAPILNIPLDRIMSAYSDAQDIVEKKKTPIDVGG